MPSPHDGTGANWDNAYPTDSDFVADGAKEIRDLRAGIEVTMNAEFQQLSNGVGITHSILSKLGSARSYVSETAPTLRPDGSTLLTNTATDSGRLWTRRNSSTPPMYSLYTHGADTGTPQSFYLTGNPFVIFYGTTSGTFTSGADRTRALTTAVDVGLDSGSDYTLSSNQVTFDDGTWLFYGGALGNQCGPHAAKLENVSGGSPTCITLPGHGNVAAGLQDFSLFWGYFSGSPTIEVRHQCTTTRATDGFGVLTGFAGEATAFFIAIRESERK